MATLSVANPVVILLLTQSVLLALLISACSVLVIQALASRPAWKLVNAYVFNAMALLSIFAHAEVVFVFGFPDYVLENLYTIEDGYYFNKPFLDQTFRDKEYVVRYRTNSQGLRISTEHDPNSTYTTADWLVLGDSFTQGAQVDYGSLYTTRLASRFPNKIVVNAGISGLGLGHEYNYYVKEGYRLGADVVVLQLCSFNDFTSVEPSQVGLSDRLITHSAFLRFLLADFKFTNPATLPLGRWTEPFHPDPEANTDFNIFYNDSSATKQRDIEAFERYLALLHDAVTERGARLVVALIPTKEQVRDRYLQEVLNAFSIPASKLDMRRPNEWLANLTGRLNIPLVDLLPAFRESVGEPFLEYDEHMSETGHRVMADALETHLEKWAGIAAPRLLSADFASERYPLLSRDGSLMTYQGLRDGNMELFLATADLRERRRLTYNDVDESHPMLSKDNRQVVFTEGSPDSQRTSVVLMNIDGSNRRRLTAPPRYSAIPTFSPSDLQIAYAEWTLDGDRFSQSRIVVLDVINGQTEAITPSDRESWRPVFSPDGRRVFYISRIDGQLDLCVFDLRTRVETRLTSTRFDEWDPQVTPDGSGLVYAAKDAGDWDLFFLDLATRETRRLTNTKGDEWDPSVSPDGNSLLFGGRFGVTESIYEILLSDVP